MNHIVSRLLSRSSGCRCLAVGRQRLCKRYRDRFVNVKA
jgi:hypothetical protein